jgi:putative intracellular protease/amidase
LCCLSGENKLQLQTEKGNPKTADVGFDLKETTTPIIHLKKEGFQIVYGTSQGQRPVMDKMSDSSVWFNFNIYKYIRAKKELETMYHEGLDRPRPFYTINEEEIKELDGILIPGGHAALGDLWKDAGLGRILRWAHEHRIPIGTICHGTISLLSTLPRHVVMGEREQREVQVQRENIDFPFSGYNVTTFSNTEEKFFEKILGGKVPFYGQEKLSQLGCNVSSAKAPFLAHIVKDRELLSAENPTSVGKFTKEFVMSVKIHNDARGGYVKSGHAKPEMINVQGQQQRFQGQQDVGGEWRGERFGRQESAGEWGRENPSNVQGGLQYQKPMQFQQPQQQQTMGWGQSQSVPVR